jgi:hypothetical protein
VPVRLSPQIQMRDSDAPLSGPPAADPSVLPAAPAAAPPPSGIGLAMAGGVVEGGFYEVGVLCALEDSVRGLALNALDVYVGVSSGALLSALLANGVSPRTLSRAIVNEAGPELDLRPELLFDAAWDDYARSALRAPRVLARALRRALARPVDESPYALLMELGAAVPAGLFAGREVERYLARALAAEGRSDDFRRLRTRLRVVAVDLDTSELVDFGTPRPRTCRSAAPCGRASRCPGSTSRSRSTGGTTSTAWRGGRCTRASPSARGRSSCSASTRSCRWTCAGRVASRRAGPLVGYGLPAVLSQTFRTLVHSRMTTGLANYRHTHPDADVLLIEPAMTDHRLFFSNIFSFSNRRGVAEHAYQSTRRWLREHAASVAPVLARHGLELRADVLADASRTLYPERRTESRGAAVPRPTTPDGAGIGDVLARLDAALDRLDRAV